MVEQSGEPLLPAFPCYFSHTVQPLGHALPVLCRVQVRLNDVLPRLCPFLPNLVALPCSAGSQVLRHSPISPARACPQYGFWPSRTRLDRQTKACWRSPGSRACCFSAFAIGGKRQRSFPTPTAWARPVGGAARRRLSLRPTPTFIRGSPARSPYRTDLYRSAILYWGARPSTINIRLFAARCRIGLIAA